MTTFSFHTRGSLKEPGPEFAAALGKANCCLNHEEFSDLVPCLQAVV